MSATDRIVREHNTAAGLIRPIPSRARIAEWMGEPIFVALSQEAIDYNVATVAYEAELIGPKEWLRRSRPGLLAGVQGLLLDTVRAQLTVREARRLGLIGEGA